MAKGLFGGLLGGQGLQMVGKLTKQNMEKLQASKPHDEKDMEVVKRILTFAMDNCVFLLL